jgi:hypothetical protein
VVTKDKPKTYHFKIHPATNMGAEFYLFLLKLNLSDLNVFAF